LGKKKNSRNLESNPNHTAKTLLVQKWVSVKKLRVDHTKIVISNFAVQKFCISFVGINSD